MPTHKLDILQQIKDLECLKIELGGLNYTSLANRVKEIEIDNKLAELNRELKRIEYKHD